MLPKSFAERRQLIDFSIAVMAAMATAAILSLAGGVRFFTPHFAAIPAVPVIAAAGLAGVVALRLLQHMNWFSASMQAPQGPAAAVLASLLAVPVIVVDWLFGIDVVNVPAPHSFLFYPAIAVFAEIAFHVLPVAVIFAALKPVVHQDGRLAWGCIAIVSLLEPTFQIRDVWSDRAFSLMEAYVWLQVWAVNIAGLYLFRRFGFTSMLCLRLSYYFYWHIAWGHIRELMF